MKKVCNLLIMVMLLVCFFTPPVVRAADNRTIRSILEEIEKKKKEIKDNKQSQQLTDSQIKTTQNNISLIDSQIKEGNNQIIKLNEEIAKLEIEIKEKDEEIKKLINFLQISNGESEYMEYIFGAKNFTDFIYRVSITVQVTDYNNKLIEEYNQMIETNIKRQNDIKIKEEELNKKQKLLQVEVAKLASRFKELTKEQGSLEDSLKQSENQVKSLINDGCGMDETIDGCYNRLRTLPSDTSFWRPVKSGTISSLFGSRSYFYAGAYVTDYHYGLDISIPNGTPIYSVANGRVSFEHYWAGTGYVVYVEHLINGQRYTSVYEHLSNNHVLKVGTNVTKDTIIAYSGNTGQSTGPHLHLSIIKGWNIQDWYYWDTNYLNSNVDPKTKINFPDEYGSFSTRNRNCSLGSC